LIIAAKANILVTHITTKASVTVPFLYLIEEYINFKKTMTMFSKVTGTKKY